MSKVSMYTNPQLRLDGPRPSASPPQLKEIEEERESLRDHPITSPTTGQSRQTSGEGKKRSASDASSNGGTVSNLGSTPMELYSLNGFLGELLKQERMLWERNEILRHSLGLNEEHSDTENGRVSANGSVSSSGSTTTLSSEKSKDLFFIRYGQLTSAVHKYFRKLEKSHACLHLTARRANHEALRHVERAESEEEEDRSIVREVVSRRSNGAGGSVVILRDEELLVYRCALQCAQFPMLSAPCPPEGHSPTPPPPVLPSVFKTTSLEEDDSSDHTPRSPTSDTNSGKIIGDPSRPRFQTSSWTRQTSSTSGRVADTDSVDGGRLNLKDSVSQSALPPTNMVDGATRPTAHSSTQDASVQSELHLPDDSIVSKSNSTGSGKSKTVRQKRRQPSESSALSRQQASVVDSDEELELIKLVPGGAANSLEDASMSSGREHPFSPMVNREMLLNLVRDAFRQTEEQQINFEATLKQEYSRRSKGEILAKELVGQLQVLENNAHPFYKPKLFVTRNGYDLWLQGEKERVRRLIDKFWHCSLPRPQLWRNYNPIDYHKAYVVLLRKVVNAESRTDRKEPVYAGKTPSSPLSPTAQRLLTEFGLRFGVGELYRRIVYLEYLAKHFDYEIWYIKHCTEELRAIRHFVPRIRNQVTAVRREMDILRATIHLLHGQTDNSLTRIDRLFLNSDPRKGVACLIELLAEVLDAEVNLFGKKVRPVKDWLVRYLKSGFALRYERRKQIASAETTETRTVQPFVLTPTLVNSLLLDTRDEVLEYRDKFQTVFRPYFDIVPFCKVEFYKQLSNDACSLCASTITKEESRKSISLEMLGLMYRLNERDMDWQAVIEPDMQQWRQRFQNMAILWIDILSNQINEWTLRAVENDEWTLLALDMLPGGEVSLTSSPSSSPTTFEKSQAHSSRAASWHHRSLANAHIVSSIRPSPFPSPPATDVSQSTRIGNRVRISAGSSAFTPYDRNKRPPPKRSPMSETSGAITDSPSNMETSSSTSLSIAGDHPYPFPQTSKKLPRDSILTFAQKSPGGGGGASGRGLGSSNGTLKADPHRIEVSVSVYSGSDEDRFASISPMQLSPPEDTLSPPTLGQIPEDTPALRDQPNADPTDLSPSESSGNGTKGAEASLPIENGSTGQLVFSTGPALKGAEDKHDQPNGAVGGADQNGASTSSSFKFHNLLDKCGVEESDEVRSKPDPASGAPQVLSPEPGRERAESNLSDEFNRSPQRQRTMWGSAAANVESVGVAEASSKVHDVSTTTTTTHNSEETLRQRFSSGLDRASPDSIETVTPTTMVEHNQEHEQPLGGELKSFLFPVSNSPLDLVTMFCRMAHFIGELLNTLVPKDSSSEFSQPAKLTPAEYAPEVTKARNKASERQKSAKQLKMMFLKKLNRTMISSLRLYADNMLCMDLCCWPVHDAVQLIGQQNLDNLRRRRDNDEIWGCRHMVEANHGLHPGGIPCHKRSQDKFECVTRDMCIRVNNIHVLITIFQSLESHIYKLVRTDSKRPISAFGYVSSDHSESLANYRLLKSKTHQPAPCRTHYAKPPSKTSSSWPSSISTGLGPMEPDQASKSTHQSDTKKDSTAESPPKQSLDCLQYLKKVQRHQVRMIAIRMNKFCKRALSELLGLRLSTVSIRKRLEPIVDYLARHRVALKKYIYPECYNNIMENLWDCLLQDLEEEATKLRSSKRPVTDKAQMLLQTLTHLIQFMSDREDSEHELDMDTLTTTSEYLQGLLNIMTRSTDQLIGIFNRLNAFHFHHQTQARQASDSEVVDKYLIKKLRVQLRSNRRSFSGTEFVAKVMEVGRGALDETLDGADDERQSPAHRDHAVDHTGNVIDYNEDYARRVGQHLLERGMILPVVRPHTLSDASSTVLVTPPCSTDEEQDVDFSSSYESRRTPGSRGRPFEDLRNGVGGARNDMLATSASHSIYSTADPASSHTSSARVGGRQTQSLQGRSIRPHSDTSAQQFSATPDSYYKFTSAEDAEYLSVMQSQILMSSSVSTGSGHRLSANSPPTSQERPAVESEDFQAAKKGTLYLVLDLLIQRARKERVAKQFLSAPRTQMVQEQKRLEDSVNCDLIFRM